MPVAQEATPYRRHRAPLWLLVLPILLLPPSCFIAWVFIDRPAVQLGDRLLSWGLVDYASSRRPGQIDPRDWFVRIELPGRAGTSWISWLYSPQ